MDQFVDKYPNLAGVKVSYEDNNLFTENDNLVANTKSVLILGSAIDGPTEEPVSVMQLGGPKAAEKLFGGLLMKQQIETNQVDPNTGEKIKQTVKVPHQGTLIRAMYEVLRAGNQDVRLLRIDGRRAKTELDAQDVAEAFTQLLGYGAGNIGFFKTINIEENGRLLSNPIEYIREVTVDGTVVKEYTGNEINNIVLSIDTSSNPPKIYFEANKFRPGNKLEIKFDYNKRNYHEVLHTDADGVLTQDPKDPKYFASAHKFWSDDLMAGHTINVFVNGIGIPQVNSKGEFLWRVGSGDSNVTDPLHDVYTALEYEQGGIHFTTAYDVEVTNGTYPGLNGATVAVDYFYYDETPLTTVNTFDIPGADSDFQLEYTPKLDNFAVYYEVNNQRYDLTQITSENPNGEYSMIFPPEGSAEKPKVIIKAGAVPVGVKIFASYKTFDSIVESPKLIVQGKYPGEIYGGIRDIYDEKSLYGVSVEVFEDTTTEDPSGYEKVIRFYKPEEKRLTSNDLYLEYRTRELPGVRTLREFANYVNNDPKNNIVQLDVPIDAGEVKVQGLLPTNRPVFLGEYKNPATGDFELKKDESKAPGDPDRFPWLGDNGFFNTDDLASMKKLYEKLGGIYEPVEGSMDEYRLAVEGIYNKLENYAVDQILLVEAYHDTKIGQEVYDETLGKTVYVEDPNKKFSTQLAQHCAIVTAKTWETVGQIGVTPVRYTTLSEIQKHIDELTAPGMNDHFMYNEATHELILTEEGDPIDIGRYIDVVFGPEVGLQHPSIGNYVTNGATIYSGVLSTLSPEVSPTNQNVPILGLRYRLSEAQHNQLAGARYVTFDELLTQGNNRIYKIKDGVTAAQPNSDYTRRSTVSIVHATVQFIRRVANPYIGLPNGLAQRNALATAIQSGLDQLKESGLLQDFRFTIYTSAKERVLGNAFISLELVPQFETRKIFTSVGLRASL